MKGKSIIEEVGNPKEKVDPWAKELSPYSPWFSGGYTGERQKELHAREKGSGYMLSSWTSFCLAGDEITRSQHHQLLVPNGLWVYTLMGSTFVSKLV